jgi:hypothetical protein
MRYYRPGALLYAELFAYSVCHDGVVVSKPRLWQAPGGSSIIQNGSPWAGQEDDCTHFISSCVGATINLKFANQTIVCGGGLPVGWQSSAPNFAKFLVNNGIALIVKKPENKHEIKFWPTLSTVNVNRPSNVSHPETVDAIRTNLNRGDLIAYSSQDTSKNAPEQWADHYEHFAILTSETGIACHTHSRFNVQFSEIGWPFVTLLKIVV